MPSIAAARKREVIVGTRGSALALAQTQIVCDALQRGNPSLAIRVERITTTGDERADVPLAQLGRGIFVTEIETALRDGRIDFAVHSAKDLPSVLVSDLMLGAILPRADARDVLVSRHAGGTLTTLPAGARVGTSSPRRACQLKGLRPDLVPCDVRGNVDTRLRKLAGGEFDALLLAAAGLIRLGRDAEITEWLDPDMMIPSVGQGALAVEVRGDDAETRRLVGVLDHAETRAAVSAERAFLAELGAGCRAAVGAYAHVERHRLRIVALVGSTDGRQVRAARSGNGDDAEALGSAVARELLRGGGAAFLAHAGSALQGRRVAVTRAADQCAELIQLLRANGAEPVSCPTIAIERPEDSASLDALLRQHTTSWYVFTSVNAVHAVADRLTAVKARVPRAVRLAAIGSGTADVLARRIRPPDFTPSAANAETLGKELPDVAGRTVLFPRGDLAADVLAARLQARGACVREVVVYKTVAGAGVAALAAHVRDGSLDAIVFASPSSVRFAAGALRWGEFAVPSPAIVCIGATTAQAARGMGIDVDAIANTQSVGGIVEAVERALSRRERSAALSPR